MIEGNKRYLIQITEISQEKTLTEQEWKPVTTTDGKADYGYTPQIETVVKVNREVFKQNVDEIDLVAVIKAINKID